MVLVVVPLPTAGGGVESLPHQSKSDIGLRYYICTSSYCQS